MPSGPNAGVLLLLLSFATAGIPQNSLQSLPQPGMDGITLDALLERLEGNVLDFRKSVPDLLCTERAQVERKPGGLAPLAGFGVNGTPAPPKRPSIAHVSQRSESTFRLRRLAEPGAVGLFDESRIVELVDGRRPGSGAPPITPPVMLFGVFSNALNILSKEGQSCFVFRLRGIKGKQIAVDFADRAPGERADDCPPYENASGRILIDRASMHVARIERRTPHHELTPGVYGSWQWIEEYAPVTLLGRVFWMPKNIRSESESEDRTSLWTFSASYVDYHLFHAEVRIVP